MPSASVLLAIPEEWEPIPSSEEFLTKTLHNAGYNVIPAFSYEDALKIIQTQYLSAVIMTSDWAMRQDDGSLGLMEYLKDKVPTYSLITQTTIRKVGNDWFNELYDRPKHEYQHMPADIDAIVFWLSETIKK